MTTSKNNFLLTVGLLAGAILVTVLFTCLHHPLSELHLDLPSK